jgi:hypothetical protein
LHIKNSGLVEAALPYEKSEKIALRGWILTLSLAFWAEERPVAVENHAHFHFLARPKQYFPIPFKVNVTLGG